MKKKTPPIEVNAATRLTDTHCHLDMAGYENDLIEILERATHFGIDRIVTIGIDVLSSQKAIALSQRFPQISATIGVHPHDTSNLQPDDYRQLEHLYSLHSHRIVAYGEIGLDYVKGYSSPADQRHHFARQLSMARDLDLPVIVHNRDADDDTYKLLRQAGPFKRGGIMHCFAGDISFAEKILDLGFLISIPGIVTFKNATTLQDVAQKVPLESLVLETDGPFLAPHPFRGKRNEPSYLAYTAVKVAELRGITLNEVATQTTENAEKLFRFSQ